MAGSSMDKDLERVLTAIYEEEYLVDTKFYLGDSNYLVYSAKLTCSCGSEPAYLKLESRDDPYTGKTVIGHGFTINGLPAANRLDARPDINIGPFGRCSLSSLGEPCIKIRNLEGSWTNVSNTMYIGDERGITKSSTLCCNPVSPEEDITGTGVISAEDSGQMNLYQLIEDHRVGYNAMLQNSIMTHADADITNAINGVNHDVMTYIRQHRDEVLYLYGLYYPDRERVYDEFSKTADVGKYPDDAKTIRFMTYMLPKDEHVIKILNMMLPGRYSLALDDISPEDPDYNAFFRSSIDGTGKMMINNVKVARNYIIPFKDFFHESGHAVDFFAAPGSDFFSTDFQYLSDVSEATVEWSDNTAILVYKSKGRQAKTIHGWAEHDVRNELYEVGVDFLNNPTSLQAFKVTAQEKQKYLEEVIEGYFLSGIGKTLRDDITETSEDGLKIKGEIYDGIKVEVNYRLNNQDHIDNLARDIYGGITGDQVGGGHRYEYWFYHEDDPEVKEQTKKIGDRKTLVSLEAFAGFFEYIVMDISAGIEPAKRVLPKTMKALEEMMEGV